MYKIKYFTKFCALYVYYIVDIAEMFLKYTINCEEVDHVRCPSIIDMININIEQIFWFHLLCHERRNDIYDTFLSNDLLYYLLKVICFREKISYKRILSFSANFLYGLYFFFRIIWYFTINCTIRTINAYSSLLWKRFLAKLDLFHVAKLIFTQFIFFN